MKPFLQLSIEDIGCILGQIAFGLTATCRLFFCLIQFRTRSIAALTVDPRAFP